MNSSSYVDLNLTNTKTKTLELFFLSKTKTPSFLFWTLFLNRVNDRKLSISSFCLCYFFSALYLQLIDPNSKTLVHVDDLLSYLDFLHFRWRLPPWQLVLRYSLVFSLTQPSKGTEVLRILLQQIVSILNTYGVIQTKTNPKKVLHFLLFVGYEASFLAILTLLIVNFSHSFQWLTYSCNVPKKGLPYITLTQ